MTEKDRRRTLERHLHELAALIGERPPWIFVGIDRAGELVVFSNQDPKAMRELARRFLNHRGRR